MRDIETGWKYTDHISEDRKQQLASPGSFDTLVQRVVENVRVTHAYACPGYDLGLTNCLQPIFLLDLPNVGDALFNGPYGYRAQYWLHPFTGLAANRTLLDALMPKLVAALDLTESPNLGKLNVCTSLKATSAKIWIQESSSLSVTNQDLAIEPWVEEANHGVELARFGLSAPPATRFEVKGALLDLYGNEVVPVKKVLRHFDIHNYGFS